MPAKGNLLISESMRILSCVVINIQRISECDTWSDPLMNTNNTNEADNTGAEDDTDHGAGSGMSSGHNESNKNNQKIQIISHLTSPHPARPSHHRKMCWVNTIKTFKIIASDKHLPSNKLVLRIKH